MAITPDAPTVAHDVPIPMETSPAQDPRSQAVGMDLSTEIEPVGEMVTPLKIVEFAVIDDNDNDEETTVNPGTVNLPEATPTVPSEKGSTSAVTPKGKRVKVTTVGTLRKSRHLAAGKGSPSVQPIDKRRTSNFINLSDVETDTAPISLDSSPASPPSYVVTSSAEFGSSDSVFDDTESDEDFKTVQDGDDEASSEESLGSDETLGEWVKKQKKSGKAGCFNFQTNIGCNIPKR